MARQPEHEQEQEQVPIPSRSARKRSAQGVEELARQLVALSEAQLRQLPVSPQIMEELQQVRAVRSLQARDRQVRHLAACLRREEEVLPPLEAFLAGHDQRQLEDRQQFHQLEQWRDALCQPQSSSQALAEITRELPAADAKNLSRLARTAQNGDRRAFREIFRLLRQAAGPLP